MLHYLLTTNPLYEREGYYYTLDCITENRQKPANPNLNRLSLFGKEVYFKPLWFVRFVKWLFYPNHLITKCNRRQYPKLDKVWYE